MTKISIITTCYNRASTIRGAIESVLVQDYANIEYIIVDGASTDGSLDIINEYKNRVATIISEPDSGMYEAINKGIRAATGDLIGVVHSDDFLYDTHVISDIANAYENSHADFIYGDGIYVDFTNTNKVIRNWIGGKYRRWKVKAGWLPLHPTCYISKKLYDSDGFYDEQYKIAADTDLLVRFLLKKDIKIDYLKRYIIRMRMGGLSTDSKRRKQMWQEDIAVYSSHGFWALPLKLMKMGWKIPQFISARKLNG